MLERAIIADDLTGALDAAAPFAMRGIRTAVALSPEALHEAIATGARVVSVSTDSREIAPELARARVKATAAALPNGTPLFKKVDSRLKGQIEAELHALPHRRSLVAPAIPSFGRMARNGKIVGFGVVEPIDIRARLGRHAASAFVPDIESDSDLDTALALDFDLPVGARGLAEAMAKAMAPSAGEMDIPLPANRAVCVIGSTDPITLQQVERLVQTAEDVAYVQAPNGDVAGIKAGPTLTIIQAVQGSTPASGRDVALALAQSLQGLDLDDTLLVLSGGATAQVVLEQLAISVLELIGEALPGLPVARAGRLTVATKSGGFGEADSLVRLLAPYLGSRSPVRTHVG
jgi:D-threonate/D-erythronate kinase